MSVHVPVHLTPQGIAHGWREIGQPFGVTGSIVRAWADEGAPVVLLDNGRPCAVLSELWEWLSRNRPRAESDAAKRRHKPTQKKKPQGLAAMTCPQCGEIGGLHVYDDERLRCSVCRMFCDRA